MFFFTTITHGNDIEATNYKCDICNLIIKEAFYQQILAKKDSFQFQTKGFHSTEEKNIGYKKIEAIKSEIYLEDLLSFVCGKTYFYALAKDTNKTTDYYSFIAKDAIGDRYQFIRNSTIQFQNDCFEMVDDYRDELIAFFKKDHIFPVMEWCHLEKGFCKNSEALDFRAFGSKKNESDLNGTEEIVELKIKENNHEDENNNLNENYSMLKTKNIDKNYIDENKKNNKVKKSTLEKEL
ncbi:Domain of unknown function DUF3456 domain-containing protein [Strongyloides ratti]|uniref:DUF3456 domain-containing protein n=1 Tax=Strongyloides ratti TaxID=34506 RepID=A0A090L170_STRRB|nr:Domain of unknown function DUF3456 domain-containing protein [Strongyloides ratti]CEF61862.1 Domain of unknown function DUF3456 domain-containing protein [Strongyloides ratti]